MVGDLNVVASGHRETTALKLIVIYVTDSELGQMLMTCSKLFNQAPSVKSRLNSSRYSRTKLIEKSLGIQVLRNVINAQL